MALYTELTHQGLRIRYDADLWKLARHGELHDAFLLHRNSRNHDLGMQIGSYSLTEDLHEHLTSDSFRGLQGYPSPVVDVSKRMTADRTIVVGTFPRGFADKDIRVWFSSNGKATAYATMWLTAETARRDLDDAESLIDSIEFV